MMHVVQKEVAAVLAAAVMLAFAPAVVRAQTPPAPAAPAASEDDAALDVTVTYKGKGEVSPKNEITIFLFADPNINESSMPIAVGVLDQNGGHTLIKGLPPVVYIAVVYDDTGTYEREGAPPPGTPVAIHGMASGAAEAVKPDKGAKIAVTFDDSNRM
jgi:hypothetical protein